MKWLKAFAKRTVRKISGQTIPEPITNIALLNMINQSWGHNHTVTTGIPLDKAGTPIPWFTYPAIEYLSQLNLSNSSVLEWGGGNSTKYFSERCRNILTIEHNIEWFIKLRENKFPNSDVMLVEPLQYGNPSFIAERKFDIIIVDGINREECMHTAYDILNAGGIIILDNSDRHPEIADEARKNGFTQIDFHGIGPVNMYTWTTTIFFKDIINFQPLTFQPTIPKGGGF